MKVTGLSVDQATYLPQGRPTVQPEETPAPVSRNNGYSSETSVENLKQVNQTLRDNLPETPPLESLVTARELSQFLQRFIVQEAKDAVRSQANSEPARVLSLLSA